MYFSKKRYIAIHHILSGYPGKIYAIVITNKELEKPIMC